MGCCKRCSIKSQKLRWSRPVRPLLETQAKLNETTSSRCDRTSRCIGATQNHVHFIGAGLRIGSPQQSGKMRCCNAAMVYNVTAMDSSPFAATSRLLHPIAMESLGKTGAGGIKTVLIQMRTTSESGVLGRPPCKPYWLTTARAL